MMMVSETILVQNLQKITQIFCYLVVVRVRFAQPEYLYRETEGVAQVCLVKDLETAITFAVDSFTTPDTALGKHIPTYGELHVLCVVLKARYLVL